MRRKIIGLASGLIAITLLWVSASFAAQAVLTDDTYITSIKPGSNFDVMFGKA